MNNSEKNKILNAEEFVRSCEGFVKKLDNFGERNSSFLEEASKGIIRDIYCPYASFKEMQEKACGECNGDKYNCLMHQAHYSVMGRFIKDSSGDLK